MSNDLNNATIICRLGKDAVLNTNGKEPVVNFSGATSDSWVTNGEKKTTTVWHNVVIWGKLGQAIHQYLTKGQQVFVSGKIQNRSYEKDGQTKYISEIVVNGFSGTVQLLGGGDKSTTDNQQQATGSHSQDYSDEPPF